MTDSQVAERPLLLFLLLGMVNPRSHLYDSRRNFLGAKEKELWLANLGRNIHVLQFRIELSETSIGRASIAGLEKALEVLDTLGSTKTSLNTRSEFIVVVTIEETRISIHAFEVANVNAKTANLWKSFSSESIRVLKDEVFISDGVQFLVSDDHSELLRIAASDKMDEYACFSREVIRFGYLCKDPVWHVWGVISKNFTPQDQ